MIFLHLSIFGEDVCDCCYPRRVHTMKFPKKLLTGLRQKVQLLRVDFGLRNVEFVILGQCSPALLLGSCRKL
jgi:hypothetical protein